jgi:hypothetical protein
VISDTAVSSGRLALFWMVSCRARWIAGAQRRGGGHELGPMVSCWVVAERRSHSRAECSRADAAPCARVIALRSDDRVMNVRNPDRLRRARPVWSGMPRVRSRDDL